MVTVLITHEVDDVAQWLASPYRAPAFESVGFTVHTFVDPTAESRVGLIAEGPSLEELQQMFDSPKGAETMKLDGVRPETLATYVER